MTDGIEKTLPALSQLVFFRDVIATPLLTHFSRLLKLTSQDPKNTQEILTVYYDLKAFVMAETLKSTELKDFPKTETWKNLFLKTILAKENPLTLLLESQLLKKDHLYYASLLKEASLLQEIFNFDWDAFLRNYSLDEENIFFMAFSFSDFPLMNDGSHLLRTLSKKDPENFLTLLNTYIYQQGLGIFCQSSAFKLNDLGELLPIKERKTQKLEDLVGYGFQKKQIIDNTKALINFNGGLHVLLQGNMGTGKSSTVRALLQYFKKTALKIIEIKKDQLTLIPELFKKIEDRPYPFIIFIDDLSFEAKDHSYKILKGVLEGSLEDTPKNVRIYATSNRRHFVEERFSERDDAVHFREVLEEKLSLSSRFGLVLTYSTPNQEEYLEIVHALAKNFDLSLPLSELDKKAIIWERRHLTTSGRSAEQLIQFLLAKEKSED